MVSIFEEIDPKIGCYFISDQKTRQQKLARRWTYSFEREILDVPAKRLPVRP